MKKLLMILVVIAGIAALIYVNFGSAAKKAIEVAGSQALGVPVHVGGVKVSVSDRSAELSGLAVSNPPGYKELNMLQANNISVKLGDVSQELVVIKSVVIDGMQVAYELGQGGTNFDVIKNNMRSGGKGSTSGGEASQGSSSASAPEVVIEQLRIVNAKLIPAIGGQQAPISLPEMVINNIGSKQNPATTAQVANQIMGKIMQTSSVSMINSGVSDGVKKIKEGLKGLF